MAKESVKVPTKSAVMSTAGTSLKAGVIGGVGVALGTCILGPVLGPAAGGIVAGASLPESEGKIVSINAVMDSVITMMLAGGQ